MKLKSFFLTMLMLAGFSMANAKIVEIGTNANKSSNPDLPLAGYSNHSVSQQIYWNSILGRTSQTFSSISFFNTNDAATRTIDIYLTPTVYGTYGGGNEWVPVIESEKVFSGTVTFGQNVWTTITFDTPYDYDPTKSLAITVDDNTGETSSPRPSFLTGYTDGWCALMTYGDEDISVSDLPTINGNMYGSRNQIRLNEGDVIGLPCYSSLPTTNFYNYSFSEQIYTAEEIGGSGVITSLSFLDLTADFSRNIALYLVHTDKTAFDNGIDWINVSASDKVFDGTVNFEKGTWTPIHFDVPFKYDGLKNLAVVVKDKTNSYDKIEQFAVFPTELNQSLYDARDDAEHNLSNLSAYTGISNAIKSQIQFNIEPGLIGDGGTSTDSYLPTYTWYKYSLSQQIYTKEELGGAQDLTSVSFFNAGTQVTRNLNIYLVPTYATEFADGNSWIAFNESNLVFSGKVTFYEDVWTPITFTTPYSYNGKTNLALVVADNTGRYASYGYRNQLNCRSFSANKMSLYCYKDAVESAESITSIFGTVGSSKNQICINRADDVPNGPELLNSYTYPYSIYLKWRDDGSCDTWELQYREADELTWHTEILTSNSYTASDLMSYRDYFIRVRKVFEDGSVSKWMSLVFNTPLPEPYNIAVETTPTSATIDWRGYTDNTFDVMYYNKENFDIIFYDDFDEYTFSQKGWTRLMNGETPPDYSNGWTDGRDRPFSMYYSAISYSWYDYNTYHADNWLISPLVDLKGTLSFWQYVSGNYPDSYEVKLSTSGNDISDFVYTLRPLSPGEPGWNEMRYDLSPYEGEKGYIAIHHKDYDQMLLSIDNFMIFTGEMHYVNTGELSWVTIEGLQPNTEYGYIIYAHKLGDYSANSELDYFTTLPTNPTPYAIVAKPELTSAELSWKGYSDSYKVKYRTAEKVEYTPLFEDDFENGLDDKGWTIVRNGEGTDETDWHQADYKPHTGSYSARAGSWDSETSIAYHVDNWLITPLVDLEGTLKFWVRCGNDLYPENYAVLLSTTGNAIDDFTITLRDMQPCTTETYEQISIDLSAYEGQKGYIAIRHQDYDKASLYIDDFGIYKKNILAPAGEWQEMETTELYATIEGLERETEYDYQIIGIKTGEEDAASEIATFTTASVIDLVFYTNENNEGAISTNSGKYANVTIEGRTLRKDGKWWGICLPFDLELEGSILEGADLRTAEDVKEVDNYLIVDCLTPLTKLEAGVPYIIKWDEGENIVNPVFKEVKVKSGYHPKEFFSGDVIFQGTSAYQKGSDTPADYFYLFDGNLKIAKICLQGHARDAFESYFYVKSSLNDTKDGIGINVGNIFDTITGVDDVEVAKEPTTIYNVAGQRLGKTQKGINIVNGKKVLVK